MSWTPELKQQYDAIRKQLVNNYLNNLAVIRARSTPAALDYPGAVNEVDNSKQIVDNVTRRLAEESDKLAEYLKIINSTQGTDLANEISETEYKLRKLESENKKYEAEAELRKGQASAVYNKYERNYHSQNYMYAPWEVTSSKWFSYSPTSSYINFNPAARSGILFIAFFFGFCSILVIGAKVLLTYYYNPGSISTHHFKALNLGTKHTKQGIIRRF